MSEQKKIWTRIDMFFVFLFAFIRWTIIFHILAWTCNVRHCIDICISMDGYVNLIILLKKVCIPCTAWEILWRIYSCQFIRWQFNDILRDSLCFIYTNRYLIGVNELIEKVSCDWLVLNLHEIAFTMSLFKTHIVKMINYELHLLSDAVNLMKMCALDAEENRTFSTVFNE